MGLRRRYVIGLLFAGICVLGISVPAKAETENHYPGFIDWGLVESWTLTQEFYWLENGPMIEWLQYWLRIPVDGIYGPQTLNAHKQRVNDLNWVVAFPEAQPGPRIDYGPDVERWRNDVVAAIERYGGPATDISRFLSVMRCESQGLPDATNSSSGAAGLMQHLPQYWDWRARMAGYEGASPYDPIANINVSAWLLYEHSAGGWAHWNFGCLG